METKVKRFSDFAEEEISLEGVKVKVDCILNQEIYIIGYKIKKSRYSKNSSGKYLTIQFEQEGTTRILFTGSDVLIDQVCKYADEIPFITTIKKVDKYYTLS